MARRSLRDGFAGRDRELRAAESALSSAAEGLGQSIAVFGASGIGKSTLCDAVARRARAAGFRIAWGRCWPEPGAPPLWPWQEIVEALAGSPSDMSQPFEPISDGERFAQISQAMASVRAAVGCDRPALVIVEDFHDADPSAVLLARLLARTCADVRMLLVVTWRDDVSPRYPELDSLLDALVRECAAIELEGLAPSEIGALARGRGRDDLDPRDLDRLHELSGGNPLLVHALLDRPTLDVWTIPANARSLLDDHVDRLDPATVALVTDLAVFGRATEAELARLAQHDREQIRALVAPAEHAGVVSRDGDGMVRLSHELYRARVLERAAPTDVMHSHRRAADVLRRSRRFPSELAALAAVAGHSFAAAELSDSDRQQAVSDCVVAAAAASRVDAFEQAAELYSKAVQLSGSEVDGAPAALLVHRAEAVLRCGRLIEARQLFEDAVRCAEEQGDIEQSAVAALRLGGIWVNERRQHADRIGMLATQRACLDRLPKRDSSLALRLRTRLAAEAVYDGGAIEDVSSLVDTIRETGDTRALMEALSMYHHCLLGPDHRDERLPVADELLHHAVADGDGLMALMGLCWRAVDLLLADAPRAAAAADQLRIRAEAVHSEHVLFIVRCHETMAKLRRGELAAAEASANETFSLGTRVGDADALAYFGGHLFVIRFLQNRCSELLPLMDGIAGSADLAEFDHSFVAGIAMAASAAGDRVMATRALDVLVDEGLATLPRMSTWLATMLGVCFAASVLERTSVLEEAYGLLLPYRSHAVRPSLAVACYGSVEWPLGLAADALGKIDRAIAHFSAAVEANERLANRPTIAVALGALADALARRGAPADRRRAVECFEQAAQIGDSCEMSARSEVWRGRSLEIAAQAGASPRRTADGQRERVTVTVTGTVAEFRLGAERGAVPVTIGVGYLQRLIAEPSTDIAVEQLVGLPGLSGGAPSRQAIADVQALASYRKRAQELRAAIDSAEDANDIGRAARERLELDRLLDHLDAMVNDRGMPRTFADLVERTRISAQKAIRRTIVSIATTAPQIGEHLDRCVRTGRYCRYEADVG